MNTQIKDETRLDFLNQEESTKVLLSEIAKENMVIKDNYVPKVLIAAAKRVRLEEYKGKWAYRNMWVIEADHHGKCIYFCRDFVDGSVKKLSNNDVTIFGAGLLYRANWQ